MGRFFAGMDDTTKIVALLIIFGALASCAAMVNDIASQYIAQIHTIVVVTATAVR